MDKFENLNNSIMFNLMLSAKELFHSNLLGYLFNLDKTLFGKIIDNTHITVKDVEREKNNIDIKITDENDKFYLIENKVKDIINDKQMEKIMNKNNNYEKYYLFTLLGNNLKKLKKTNPSWEEIGWQEIGYEEIIQVLKEHHFNNKTVELIKIDYCAFMDDMISLLKQQFLDCNHYMLFNNNILKQYKKIRLHDVFQKYGASHFVNYFERKYPETEIVSSYSYMRNGIMTFSLKIVDGAEYYVEIQIEKGKYRKCIVCKIKSKETLLSKFELLGWFKKDWESPRDNKSYLQYDHKDEHGTKRWYQEYDEKVNNMSYDDLCKKIKSDLDDVLYAINNSNQ